MSEQARLSALGRHIGEVSRAPLPLARKEHGNKSSPRKYDSTELEGVSKVVAEVDQSKLDSIFSMSVGLDGEAITDFICSICKVSRDELSDEADPRIFSLQKLVEVADLNMSRIAFVWKDIWKDVSQHLVEAGKHPNSAILTFAIDSLKQLAHKFLAVRSAPDNSCVRVERGADQL